MTSRRRRLLLGSALVALVLTGCSNDRTSPTTATPTVAPKAAAAPKPGSCYLLAMTDARRPTSTARPVPCSGRHTAVTVFVGHIHPVMDGHLLALDSAAVQRQIGNACRRKVDAHVGGTVTQQRLSRVQAVWFSPSPAQADRGALWYRCDLVVSASSRRLLVLPLKTRHLLGAPGAMSRYGTCGTAAPASRSFQRVLCSARHTWRARSVVSLPAGATYLAKKAGKVADARCRDIAGRLDPKTLRLRWSFEWPTRAQFAAGQRYGLCWTPT